jgi:hypothetical protein
MYKSGEIYDVLNVFKRTYKLENSTMEEKSMWKDGHYFCNGEDNELFKSFLNGYSFRKSIANTK